MRRVLLLPILLWSASTALPQAVPPREKCAIQGRVSDLITGEPLRRVRLVLRSLDRNRTAGAASSDDSGAFAIADLEPGQYRLSAERNGYNRQEYGARGQSSSGATLTLAPGQELTGLAFKLIPYGVVAGRIVDEDSEPVAGAFVTVQKFGYARGGRRRLERGGNATTNDLGEYRVYGLAPGRYVVSAAPRPVIEVPEAAGRGAPDAQSETATVPTYFPGANDANNATPVDLGAGAKVQGINFRLLTTRPARIRGRVANLIPPQPGGDNTLSVYLLPKGGGLAGFASAAVRDANGGFEFRGVVPGSYLLSASFSQGGRRYAATRQLEALPGQTLEGVNVEIGPGVGIAGTVRVEGDTPVNLGGLSVALEPRGMDTVFQSINSRVGGNRTFLLANVPPGAYDIEVLGLPEDLYLKSVLVGRQDVADSGVDVQPGGGASQIEVVLSAQGAQVEAVVNDQQDRPAAGVQVVLVPDEQHWFQDRLFKSAATDQNGHCLIKGVAPGDYRLFALDGVDAETLKDRDLLKKLEKLGEAVTVGEKERAGKQLKLATADPVMR